MSASPAPVRLSRTLGFVLFATGLLWALASSIAAERSAQGLANQFNFPLVDPLLRQCFWLLLMMLGFTGLRWMSTRAGGIRQTNGLLSRPSAGREFAIGMALGWGLLLAVVLPLMLTGSLHPQFSITPASLGSLLILLPTLLLATLALEVAFRGYLFRRLIDSLGPVAATVLLSLLYAIAMNFDAPTATFRSVLTSFALGLLFSLAYLRSHALWLGWGLHFAWAAAMTVIFGLPLAGLGLWNTVVLTDVSGPDAWTGGGFGPEGSVLTLVAVIAAIAVLYRVTRDLAWEYTYVAPLPGGYPMEAQPPAAHRAMEAAAVPAPLVQILSTTSTTSSTLAAVDEHLRERRPAAAESAPASFDEPPSPS